MATLVRPLVYVGSKIHLSVLKRSFTLASSNRFKEIIEEKKGNTLTIRARIVPDPDEHRLVKRADTGACVLCSLGLDVKHTDVLILSQFLRPDGCVMPKRVTGLCIVQQRRVEIMVAMAQKAGLMPNLAPANSKKDPKRRWGPKKYNSYYDETTIVQKYRNVTLRP